VAMQVTFILITRAVDEAILQLMTSIDRNTWDYAQYYCFDLCIINEQPSDQEESK
jgi:hypothetical protein